MGLLGEIAQQLQVPIEMLSTKLVQRTMSTGRGSSYTINLNENQCCDGRDALAKGVLEEAGKLDFLINNAGITRDGVFMRMSNDDFDDVVGTNLRGAFLVCRAFARPMMKARTGRIINIASTEGLGASSGTAPYTAAKHGVIGLTRSMAVELGAKGVTANCICPGPILTGLTENIPEPAREKFARRRVPIRRYGSPEEVAQITLSLALPAASYLNGAVIPVDGGMTVQNT